MKRSLPLLALLLVAITAAAAPRSLNEARAAALSLWQRTAAKHAPGHTADINPQLVYTAERTAQSSVSTRAAEEAPYYYVFTRAAGADGYAIISGDDRLPAIVGYTARGEYNETTMPDALVEYLMQYRAFLDQATDEQIAEAAAFRAQQQHAAVEPFIKTQWNQTAPYNNMCPSYNGNRCLTGCVATAVAQVLKYYNSPSRLLETIPSYSTTKLHLTQPKINAGESYDWGNMLNAYSGSESPAEKNAVAKLMYHVGCALSMDYTLQASSATLYATVLINAFGMDKETTQKLYRSAYNITDWDSQLYAEILAQRPVIYSGQSSGSGHAFVIDGYNNGLYHVNWGWGGVSDGMYDITILNPHNNSGAGASSSSDGYSMGNEMIVGLQPDNGRVDPSIVGKLSTMNSADEIFSAFTFTSGTVTATATFTVINWNDEAISRKVSIGYRTANGIVAVATPTDITLAAQDGNSGKGRTVTANISFQAIDGETYTLFPVESADGQTWAPCIAYDKADITLRVAGGKLTTINTPAALNATVALNAESAGFAGMTNTIDVTITNNGEQEYYDRIYVMSSTSQTMPSGYTYSQGITVVGSEQTVVSFQYTPQATGTVNFWVLDAKQKQIGTGSVTFKQSTPPQLSFQSITVANASTRKSYHPFQSTQVEMVEVNDTKADFVFEIRNDGGYYEADFPVGFFKNADAQFYSSGKRHMVFPANATTSLTMTMEGAKGETVGAIILNYQGKPQIAQLATPIIHHGKDGLDYLFSDRELAYLNGSDPTAIAAPSVDTSATAPCYNLNGQRVNATARGIIIQNGRKVVRR